MGTVLVSCSCILLIMPPQSEAVPSDLSESEENDDQLGSDSDVAMDTAEQQELT